MKITVLARYGRRGASSRLRMFQFLPWLQEKGFETRMAPFFEDAYLQRLYSGRSTLGPSLQAYARQIRALPGLADQDLIWIEKEALPWLPWAFERRLLPRHVPIVSDYDDAVFHRYDMHRLVPVRRILGRKIDRVMAGSARVLAGNAYLAARARAAGASTVDIVPTVVDVTQYRLAPPVSAPHTPRIGWIGTPSTWQEFLVPMLPMLHDIARQGSARLLVVGAGQDGSGMELTDHRPWSEETEVAQIQEMDIGIMPLTDTPWAQGKCGYKLIQYMACGLPVIASPVGVNREIVSHGVNGYLARTEQEWRDALTRLLGDRDLRATMGAAGRKTVEERYSLQVWGPRVADLLFSVAAGGRAR